MTDTIYEIFVVSSIGVKVFEKDTLEQALAFAKEQSMRGICIDCDIDVNKVVRTKIKTFRNGGEVA